MRYIHIIGLLLCLAMASCIEDGISTSPSDQPAFSVDTLHMGVVYTDQLTTTSKFAVYNRHNKGINLQRIALSGPNAQMFQLNVDGMSGEDFTNIEIRPNDSIFVMVQATLPESGEDAPTRVCADVDFTVCGVVSKVVVAADGQDVVRLHGETLTRNTRFTAGKPYVVYDSLIVDQGVTLTMEPGARVFMHDKAWMAVLGTLRCEGTPENPISITGDRTGDVIPGVSFDLMSRQWGSIDIYPPSTNNYIAYTTISNSSWGVAVYGDGSDVDRYKLTLVNSRLRNSGECVLYAFDASVEAYGCEFAEAAYGLVYLVGGSHRFDQCTVSNNYLFSAIESGAWNFINPSLTEEYADAQPLRAYITNSITYGLGPEITPADISDLDVVFENCLFGVNGEDDANFVHCLWDVDPLFYTIRSDYHFDYRLKPDSPAIGAANPEIGASPISTDYYGADRTGVIGAYAPWAE